MKQRKDARRGLVHHCRHEQVLVRRQALQRQRQQQHDDDDDTDDDDDDDDDDDGEEDDDDQTRFLMRATRACNALNGGTVLSFSRFLSCECVLCCECVAVTLRARTSSSEVVASRPVVGSSRNNTWQDGRPAGGGAVVGFEVEISNENS